MQRRMIALDHIVARPTGSGGEMAGLEVAVAVAEARIAFVAKEVAFLDSELNDMTEVRESVFTNAR